MKNENWQEVYTQHWNKNNKKTMEFFRLLICNLFKIENVQMFLMLIFRLPQQ